MNSFEFSNQVSQKAIHQLMGELHLILPQQDTDNLKEDIENSLAEDRHEEGIHRYRGTIMIINQNNLTSEKIEELFNEIWHQSNPGFGTFKSTGLGNNLIAGDATDIPLPGDNVCCPNDKNHYNGLLLFKNQYCLICGRKLVKLNP